MRLALPGETRVQRVPQAQRLNYHKIPSRVVSPSCNRAGGRAFFSMKMRKGNKGSFSKGCVPWNKGLELVKKSDLVRCGICSTKFPLGEGRVITRFFPSVYACPECCRYE